MCHPTGLLAGNPSDVRLDRPLAPWYARATMTSQRITSALLTIGSIIAVSQPAFAHPRADVWAVGIATSSAAQTLTEHWDGNVWSIVPSPNAPLSTFDSLVAVTALSSRDVWAAGEYDTQADFNQTLQHGLTEHWDGLQWSVGPPSKHDITAISSAPSFGNDFWLVGHHTQFFCRLPLGCGGNAFAYRWNGRAWKETAVQQPTGGEPVAGFNGVQALADGAVWAVGYVWRQYGTSDLIERWSSGVWSVIASGVFPHAFLTAVSGKNDSDIWVIGNTKTNAVAGHWNGMAWTRYPLDKFGAVFAIVEVSANDVWAVGTTGQTAVEHWDGVRWKVVPSPNIGSLDNRLNAVTATASNDVWAVGSYDDSPNHQQTLIEHWDGVSWSIVPSPNQPNASDALSGVTSVPITVAGH